MMFDSSTQEHLWTDAATVVRRVREEKDSEDKGTGSRKKIKNDRKRRQVGERHVFPMLRGSGGSKSTLAKAAGAKPSGAMRDRKLHTVVARRRARSAFGSQDVTSNSGSEHFWQWSCSKSAHCCGAKQISKPPKC